MSEVTERNIKALYAGLKEARRQNGEVLEMFQKAQDQLTMVLAEQAQMRSQINMLIAMKGVGATSGNNS